MLGDDFLGDHGDESFPVGGWDGGCVGNFLAGVER